MSKNDVFGVASCFASWASPLSRLRPRCHLISSRNLFLRPLTLPPLSSPSLRRFMHRLNVCIPHRCLWRIADLGRGCTSGLGHTVPGTPPKVCTLCTLPHVAVDVETGAAERHLRDETYVKRVATKSNKLDNTKQTKHKMSEGALLGGVERGGCLE